MGTGANGPMARHLPHALLMCYVAHVQRTGRCHYPPLETHLRQWAQERRLREGQAPQEEPEHETPALKTAPHERDAVPEPVPIPLPEQDLRREPISRQPLPPEPRAALPAAAEPMPPTPQAAAQEPAPALEPATPPGAPLLAPAGSTTASTAPAAPAPAPAAPSTPATADDGADRANPQLERLRLRCQVQVARIRSDLSTHGDQ